MSTRKDVARLAGVSTATVSNVFGSSVYVAKETEEKVRNAAKSLKYVPNHLARSLSLGRSNHIGIAINESTNPFHMEIIKSIEDHAVKNNFMVTVFDLNDNITNKTAFIERRQLDGLINFTTTGFSDEFITLLTERNTVLSNFGLDVGMSFGQNEVPAVIECMQTLSELGHKKIGYVSTMDSMRFKLDDRGKTFLANRDKFGFECNDNMIEFNSDYFLTSGQIGYDGARALLDRRPDITALFASNDLAAIGAIRAINDIGLKCPQDISVIGCDDIELSRLYIPSVSTIAFDKHDYGTKMAEKIISCVLSNTLGIGYECIFLSKPIFRESIAKVKT